MKSYIRLAIILTSISIVAISFGLVARLHSIHAGISFGTGAALGVVNGVAGLEIIDRNIGKNTLTFLKIVLMSMGLRMIAMFLILILLIKLIGIQIIPLVVGLIVYYFVMTIFEIVFLNKRGNLQKVPGTEGDVL